jgi:GalNAc-alpha-(1->4)-GalNAc-alpha-(1->3)-diNAcBac-PP-undecaprenol alpha-1,4-N-acetyl-D-galactosaminyltransferase
VMTNLAEHLYESGWRVTLVTTYCRLPEYVLPHGLWDPQTGQPYGKRRQEVPWGSHRHVEEEPAGIHRIYSDPPREKLEKGRVRGFLARFVGLREIWKEEKPDLILSFIGYNNIFAILTSVGLRIPVVVSVRSNPSREYASAKLRIPAFLLFRRAAGVILQTSEAKAFFPKVIQKKAAILPNAINPDFVRPRYEGERRKEIVSVGRLDANKNQTMLLKALAKARAKGREHPEILDYSVHFYGDGPMREALEQLAAELGLSEAAVFHGNVSDVRSRIEKSRIYVLTSKEEGMPNALLEAMSAGLACISADCPCGGPRDLIQDGKNGFLVPVDDSDALAERLLMLVESDTVADQMGQEASRVQESYNLKTVNGRWETYLEDICSRKL